MITFKNIILWKLFKYLYYKKIRYLKLVLHRINLKEKGNSQPQFTYAFDNWPQHEQTNDCEKQSG